MTFDEWVKKYSGKAIDYDGTYGVQCVDLVKHYVKNVLGISPQSIGNAIEYYNKRNKVAYLKDNFRWHNNTPDFIPKKGDICVFTSKSGNGHVSVATGEGTNSYFYSYDQNYPKAQHEPMTKIKHSYNSFLGVLRPKSKGKSTSKYFKAYNGTGDSIVDALESLKIDSSFSNRKKIAKKNQIAEYTGTPRQNLKMLNLLKQGKLLKP
ncbi:CHAP domain-containing protein [Eubacterium sp.]|uniref:CHAP domain-containing protein n=1 Tax=Eubacterium sp. TaxID=142586 RepID=UPI003EFC151F